jgi:hypothetical protein
MPTGNRFDDRRFDSIDNFSPKPLLLLNLNSMLEAKVNDWRADNHMILDHI